MIWEETTGVFRVRCRPTPAARRAALEALFDELVERTLTDLEILLDDWDVDPSTREYEDALRRQHEKLLAWCRAARAELEPFVVDERAVTGN